MITAIELIDALRTQGMTLSMVGEKLRVEPKPTDGSLIELLRMFRPEIVRILTTEAENLPQGSPRNDSAAPLQIPVRPKIPEQRDLCAGESALYELCDCHARHLEDCREKDLAHIDRLARVDGWVSPAESIIRTCLAYNVGRLARSNHKGQFELVVASNGNAWRSLVRAIEAHVRDVYELTLRGWIPEPYVEKTEMEPPAEMLVEPPGYALVQEPGFRTCTLPTVHYKEVKQSEVIEVDESEGAY
jgi:hypothetical protein